MKKKVIVACGGAVATSTIAANAIVELAKENNIDIEIAQVRISARSGAQEQTGFRIPARIAGALPNL